MARAAGVDLADWGCGPEQPREAACLAEAAELAVCGDLFSACSIVYAVSERAARRWCQALDGPKASGADPALPRKARDRARELAMAIFEQLLRVAEQGDCHPEDLDAMLAAFARLDASILSELHAGQDLPASPFHSHR